MKKFISSMLFFIISILALVQISFAQDISVEHDLKDFEEIRIDDVGIELEVSVGKDFEVLVEGHEVNVQNLKLKVNNDVLVIYRDEKKKSWGHRGNSKLKVIVKMPKFTKFDLRGAVDAEINNVDSDDVEFDLRGAGNIEVSGKCKTLNVELRGAGNFEAEDLKCEVVEVELRGAGNIEVYASEEINAEINGMGNIDVYGKPKKVTKDDGFFSNIDIH